MTSSACPNCDGIGFAVPNKDFPQAGRVDCPICDGTGKWWPASPNMMSSSGMCPTIHQHRLEPASMWVTNKARPPWGEQFIMQAYVTALRGSCLRKRVGSVIVDANNRIVSGGFNGAPSKQPDCLTVGCDVRVIDGRPGCQRTLHAESNALDYAGRGARGCALFTTVIPCRPCAMRIIQAGIDSVFYSEFYESQGTKETKDLLTGAGVKLMQLTLPLNELTVALRRAVGEIP